VLFWLSAVIVVPSLRAVARAYARTRPAYIQRTLILGAGQIGQLVARKLIQHPEYGIQLIGFVDSDPLERRSDVGELPVLGGPDELASIVQQHEIERVLVAFSGDSHQELLAAIRSLARLDVQIDIVPRLYELVSPNLSFHSVEGVALLGLPPAKMPPSSRMLKRTIDLIGASLGLFFTAPLFVYAAWRIHRESPGPIFFRQERVGLDMRRFTMLKFRTMVTNADQSVHEEYIKQTMNPNALVGANGVYKLQRENEITPFGRWLRKTSLDELPQLVNVLRGQMSLVGPRPCIPYELEHFAPHHFERFLARPGLTGLWQVHARSRATFGEALEMDVAYVRGWSLALDLGLLCRTPVALTRTKGAA
jgi:exopolysaccharide biosynthesis polyprenyl glycosylphosphotransferase